MSLSPAIIFLWLAIGAGPATDTQPVRDEWRVVTLPDGVELRYLPPHVSDADYPVRARRIDAEGTSLLRLEVDSSGRLTNCAVIRSSGFPDLDERGCLLYRSRARFEPRCATQRITLHAPMTWRLEDASPPPDATQPAMK